MEALAQELIFGLFIGSIYAVVAAGLALVFGVLKILNVAHGELLMIGGYLSFWLFTLLGSDPFLALLVVIPALYLLGLALDRLLFRHLLPLPPELRLKNSLLVSFGLALILQQTAQQLFTADERTIQVGYAGLGLTLFGVALPYTRLLALLLALVSLVVVHLYLQRTDAGREIRAVAEDDEGAALVGIDRGRVYRRALGLGTALAGLAGGLVIIGYGVDPGIGLPWTLKAVVVVTLAGTGSLLGALPAGLLLGLVEALSGMTLGATAREIAGLVLFLLALVLRPSGLFRRR